MKKLLWISMLFLLPFFCGAAQHVSGYITMKWIGGNTYQATFVDYTNSSYCDSEYTNVDTLRISWGDGNYDLLTRSNGTGDSICACRNENVFTGTHTFPGPGSYHIWVLAGPRIANIQNMQNSSFQSMLIYNTLSIPPGNGEDSSLPVITNPPVCSYGCPTQCYYYNPDVSYAGDSISYSLGNCGGAMGYYNPGATIDAHTGEITWCNPSSVGLYNFSILITTYMKTYIRYDSIIDSMQAPIDTEEMELEVDVENDCSLGVNEVKGESEKVSVYPNPSNGMFNIGVRDKEQGVSEIQIGVYNVLGEEVYNATLKQSRYQSGQGDDNINLSSQPNGVYLYRVVSDDGSLLGEGKLVIQK